MELTPVMQKFILHWGEMGTRWGVNRSVAQIHALLYIAGKPIHAEDISATLTIARSNVSTSLRELQNWGIVRTVHVLGDRRDHFESIKGVWEMFQIILEERKKREVDPTVAVLSECVAELHRQKNADPETKARLEDLLDFFQMMTDWYDGVSKLPQNAVRRLVKLGSLGKPRAKVKKSS